MRASLYAAVLLCTLSATWALNYIFDENLFSKDTWELWKLDNPLEALNAADEISRLRDNPLPPVQNTFYNSLDGPSRRKQDLPKPGFGAHGNDIEALEDEAWLEPAAKASQCTVCHVLVTAVWQRMTNDLISGDDVTQEQLRDYLDDACDREALDAVLKKYTIYKMESDGGPQTALMFFVIRERRTKGPATDAEEAAVALSCKNLVKESGKDLVAVLMDQLATYRREAVRALVKHGRDGGNQLDPLPADKEADAGAVGRKLPPLDGVKPRGAAGADDDDDYVDPDDLDDEGNVIPAKQRKQQQAVASAAATQRLRRVKGLVVRTLPGEAECVDLHARCAEWASIGECEANPNYMIGSAVHRGHCRRACGLCQPAQMLAAEPALLAEMEALSSALLLAAKNLGCGASAACLTGVSGTAVGAGIVKQKRELPKGMVELPGGFILGRPWWSIPHITRVPSDGADGAAGDTAAAADASDASSSGSGSSSGGGSDSGGNGDAPSHSEVDAVLRPVLGSVLLTIPSDFFMYEYLYKNHTRHYHQDKDTGKFSEDWLLGKFTRESIALVSSTTGEVAGLDELDLLGDYNGKDELSKRMRQATWPYVKQVYAGGDECVLGGGRRVVRRTEARIACSPDDNTYMLVREPDFCTYVFVIYVPQLCTLDYYRPRPVQGQGAGSGEGPRWVKAGGKAANKAPQRRPAPGPGAAKAAGGQPGGRMQQQPGGRQ